MGSAIQVQNFFIFCHDLPSLSHYQKQNLNLWSLPHVEVFTPNIETLKYQYWLMLYRFQEDNFGQSIWEVLLGKCWGKHWELWGTCWKPIWNLTGTYREQKNSKNIQQTATLPKRKKTRLLGCMLSHFIGSQKFLCLPMFFYHFWPRLMARVELRGLWLAQILFNCEITYITSPNLRMPFPYHHNITTKCTWNSSI